MNTITLTIIIALTIGNIYSLIKYYKRRKRKSRYRRGYLEPQNSLKHRKNKRKNKKKLQDDDSTYNAKADVTALSQLIIKLDTKQTKWENDFNRLSAIIDTLYNRMDKLEVDVTFIKDHTIKKQESNPIVFEDIDKYKDALKETKETLTKSLMDMLHKKQKPIDKKTKPIAVKKDKKKKTSKIFTEKEIDAEMRLHLGEVLFLSPNELKKEQTKAYQRLWYKHSKNEPKKK